MIRLAALLLLSIAVTSCVPRTTAYKSEACAEDADCALVNPCCACCQEVPMTLVDAHTERDRCTTVECRNECVSDQCGPSNNRAACVNGQCSAVPK